MWNVPIGDEVLEISCHYSLCFRSISTTLRSLDLSYNQLTELPVNPLSRTKSLDWLNLYG